MFIDLQTHLAHVRVQGRPENPAVVMLHSLGTSGVIWDRQADALASQNYVVRPDFRGHGYSELGSEPVTVDSLSADVIALLERLEIRRFTLAGISVGGLVAQKIAARLPGSVRSLVLLDSCIASLNPQMWIDRAKEVRASGLASIADKVVKPWSSAAGQGSLDARALRQILLQTSDAGYAACCDALATADCRAGAGQISAPTFVAVGAEDLATPPAASRVLCEAIAGASLEIIDGAGHIPLFEQSAVVTALMRKALAAGMNGAREQSAENPPIIA